MSDELVRPGPESIDPRSAPGGVVLHAYSVPDGTLLLDRRIPASMSTAEIDAFAESDGEWVTTTARAGVCVVAFDGDTGERWTAATWLEALR